MLDRDTGEEDSTAKVSRKRCACPPGMFASSKSLRSRVCQLRTALSNFPTPLQKKYFPSTFGVASSAATTTSGSTALGYPVISVVWDDSVTGCPDEYIGKSVEAFERFALPEEIHEKGRERMNMIRELCADMEKWFEPE